VVRRFASDILSLLHERMYKVFDRFRNTHKGRDIHNRIYCFWAIRDKWIILRVSI
jgi:hypothetical protein